MTELSISFDDLIDRSFATIAKHLPPVECPLRHTFTPGPSGSGLQLYAREITMPAGAIVVSEKHLTQHPFNISQGACHIRSGDDLVAVKAPFSGVTMPGTQRILFIEEDVVWTTYHIIPEAITDPADAVKLVTAPRRTNPYLTESVNQPPP